MVSVNTWKAIMLDGSTRECSVRPETERDGHEWHVAGHAAGWQRTEPEAMQEMCVCLASQGGYRELIAFGEPTRVELSQSWLRRGAVIEAALAHRAARQRLNEMAERSASVTFDHPNWRGVGETERRLDELLEPFAVSSMEHAPVPRAVIYYQNHRGELRSRQIVPEYLWHGRTQWHPTPQWLLSAFDQDKSARRDFAMGDIARWDNVP